MKNKRYNPAGEIARLTGLTGVEAGNIFKQLEKQGQDYQSFDWKSIGQNLYGHGQRTSGVKHHLKNMYGISLDTEEEKGGFDIFNSIEEIQGRRSPRARMLDDRLHAKHKFEQDSKKGVIKWKRRPNMFDLIGIDD